jgi:hypothetical protein
LKAHLPRIHEAVKNFMQQTGFNQIQVNNKQVQGIYRRESGPSCSKGAPTDGKAKGFSGSGDAEALGRASVKRREQGAHRWKVP